jgi:hypothetical protein
LTGCLSTGTDSRVLNAAPIREVSRNVDGAIECDPWNSGRHRCARRSDHRIGNLVLGRDGAGGVHGDREDGTDAGNCPEEWSNGLQDVSNQIAGITDGVDHVRNCVAYVVPYTHGSLLGLVKPL